MATLATWLKQHLWAAFLAHQAGILIIGLVFLSTVRRLTGRSIHQGRDPVGIGDGAALILLSIAVILLTRFFYHWVKGKNDAPLGISLSPRRLLDLLIGLSAGFAFIIAPWVFALWLGTASIYDRITAHFDSLSVARILTVAFLLLLSQGILEETTNRAFPMRLWEHRSLAFRIIVPAIFFVAIHLPTEPFGFERVGVLFMAGVLQGIAYALTGNIWLSSGVHTGANLASFAPTGLWHAGAVVALIGQPTIPNWLAVMITLTVFSVTFALLRLYRGKSQPLSMGAG
ncbi:MAG: CPBP family intramembrane glutamic endopeptidase [Pyrinomonadaceae bacterium]